MTGNQTTGNRRLFKVNFAFPVVNHFNQGYSLLELVVTLTVLSILAVGTIPLVQNTIKRQKEQKLREALREMRMAIDEFKRDTLGACPQGAVPNQGGRGGGAGGGQTPNNPQAPADPRSRVVIDDCKIFDNENLDRYPPTLEVLVEGVAVKSRGFRQNQGGSVFDQKSEVFDDDKNKELKKVYLREIPEDPFTGKKDWKLRSSYQTKDADGWDEVNVFDVRTSSDEEALNGDKYSDW